MKHCIIFPLILCVACSIFFSTTASEFSIRALKKKGRKKKKGDRNKCDYDTTSSSFEKYDYIIVGAGAGGSAAAYKLSENPENSVLLLEEGGYSIYPNKGEQDVWIGKCFASVVIISASMSIE